MKRIPAPLKPGDKVAIVSPASIIDPTLVAGACETLSAVGYEPVVMPHTLGHYGSYSGTKEERLEDLTSALRNPDIKAILCSRGGYGAVHLLEALDPVVASCDAKWLIGFSDISALHALWQKNGIPSIHASMCKQLALGPETEATRRLLDILQGKPQPIDIGTCRNGVNDMVVTGTLVGGNLAVIEGLAGTPYYPIHPGNILVIEDIAEPIYKVERILYRLKLSGMLDKLSALIVGRFTEYNPDRNYDIMEAMIADMTADVPYPVIYDAPVGHIGSDNMPLLLGCTVTLKSSENGSAKRTQPENDGAKRIIPENDGAKRIRAYYGSCQ